MNWVERRFNLDSAVSIGWNGLWQQLSASILSAAESYREFYAQKHGSVISKIDGPRLWLTRQVPEADGSGSANLCVEIRPKLHKVTGGQRFVDIDFGNSGPYDDNSKELALVKDGKIFTLDEASQYLTEIIFLPA
jgi:hypothetical protein